MHFFIISYMEKTGKSSPYPSDRKMEKSAEASDPNNHSRIKTMRPPLLPDSFQEDEDELAQKTKDHIKICGQTMAGFYQRYLDHLERGCTQEKCCLFSDGRVRCDTSTFSGCCLAPCALPDAATHSAVPGLDSSHHVQDNQG